MTFKALFLDVSEVVPSLCLLRSGGLSFSLRVRAICSAVGLVGVSDTFSGGVDSSIVVGSCLKVVVVTVALYSRY